MRALPAGGSDLLLACGWAQAVNQSKHDYCRLQKGLNLPRGIVRESHQNFNFTAPANLSEPAKISVLNALSVPIKLKITYQIGLYHSKRSIDNMPLCNNQFK
jgi:hypothetical protein